MLRRELPVLDGVRLLTWTQPGTPLPLPGVTAAIVDATSRDADIVVVDLARWLLLAPTPTPRWPPSCSREPLGDTNVAQQLPALIEDARVRIEAAAFVSGSGSVAPKGILTALGAASTVTSTTGSTFTLTDLYALVSAVPPGRPLDVRRSTWRRTRC